jgi:hypothetical protein
MEPDAIRSAIGFLEREYGSVGYRVVRIRPWPSGGGFLDIVHADGSMFTIGAAPSGSPVIAGDSDGEVFDAIKQAQQSEVTA